MSDELSSFDANAGGLPCALVIVATSTLLDDTDREAVTGLSLRRTKEAMVATRQAAVDHRRRGERKGCRSQPPVTKSNR